MASVIVVLLMTITPISAHSGRTDANGGHCCRTNCAKWGLRDGEYHYHNDGGSSSSSSNSSGNSSTNQSTTPKAVDYTKQGETAGYNYKKANLDANKKAIENVRNLEAEDTNSEYTLEKQKKVYKESYQSTYEQEEKEINSLKKKLSKYDQEDLDNEKQSDEYYRKYKNYKVYDVLDKKYKKEYNKYKEQGVIVAQQVEQVL